MSSSEQVVPSRRALLALACLAALALGGCFKPLYGEGTASVTGGSVRGAMTSIEVATIPDRLGHYLRNELVFDLDGSGQPSDKRLLLNVKVLENLDIVSVDYSTGRADSATLVANATWSLVNKATGQTVTSGTSVTRATYDRSSQRFATVRAARDAQIRAAKALSELIRNRIATALVAGG